MPRRRCVGCGRIAPKSELVRLAATREDNGTGRRAVRDITGTMPGRGAYLCRDNEADAPVAGCVTNALRRGAVGRALRAAVKLDAKLVESVSP